MRNALLSRLRRPLIRFGADEDGVSAVEFAILLPLMITLYLGSVEITQAVSNDRKLSLVVHTVADLVAQSSNSCVSSTDMTNIFNAAKAVVYPYDSSKMKVTVTSVIIDAAQNAKVDTSANGWSVGLNGSTTRSGDVTSFVPAALRATAGSLIWAEATYTYTPTIGYVITGSLTLNDKIFLRPRVGNSIAYPTCS